MNRYWITLENLDTPSALNLGIGVTAWDESDARDLAAAVAGNRRIVAVRLITDMATIDQKHVIPNMGNHFARGVWFPAR
jgi:hypothetical protein